MPGVAIWFGGSIERLDRGSSPLRRGPVCYGGGGGEFESTITSSAFCFLPEKKKSFTASFLSKHTHTTKSLEEEKKGVFPTVLVFLPHLL